MSSRSARISGVLSMVFLCLALGPAGAETARIMAGTGLAGRDAALAAAVDARLQQILPAEAIEVRTANAGLVLSGQVSSTDSLVAALTLAQGYAPGRVSNLMTIGHQPKVTLTLRLAEMPRPVAQNLSASMAMSGMFIPVANPGGSDSGDTTRGLTSVGMDVAGLIAALADKGVLRVLASPTLTMASGQTAHLPQGVGCTAAGDGPRPALALDVTPRVVEDGSVEVVIRSCVAARPGDSEAGAPGKDSTMTLRLLDGQTLALAGVLPETLRASALTGVAGADSVLGPLLHADAYQSGQSAVMILVTARIVDPDKAFLADGSGGRIGGGILLVSQSPARRATEDAGQIGLQEPYTLSPSFLK